MQSPLRAHPEAYPSDEPQGLDFSYKGTPFLFTVITEMGDHAYHLKSINEAVKIASPFQMATNFQAAAQN